MEIRFTDHEIERLKQILIERYDSSVNLFEIAEIKDILCKLGMELKDWTPKFEDLS